eukprot:gene12968-9277_t
MAALVTTVDSSHEDMIHDCQFDYYSKKLATCSSDRTIKVFEVNGDIYHCSATLNVHEAPVWQVGWAHPKFGVLLASCSYDGSVVIQKELSQGNWARVFENRFPEVSVNSIAWAPHEFGLMLAAACSDGKVVIIEYKGGVWSQRSTPIHNDALGCNAVSWAPYHPVHSHGENNTLVYRLVTGACDNSVRVWRWLESEDSVPVQEATKAEPHTDWVRDVAWAPNPSLPYSMFASCSEDRKVYIWRQRTPAEAWEPQLLHSFEAPVWRVSWSVTGTVLAVSTGDHRVTLWKQSVDESWMRISSLSEAEN